MWRNVPGRCMTVHPLLVRRTTPGTCCTLSRKEWSLVPTVRARSIFAMLTCPQCFTDDPNAALTLQTLNADGTPKRPMNAFMIFARRRRPQVAAENQSMRTGEVSKILSREWNAMSLVRLLLNTHQPSSNHRFRDHLVRQTVLPRSSQAP